VLDERGGSSVDIDDADVVDRAIEGAGQEALLSGEAHDERSGGKTVRCHGVEARRVQVVELLGEAPGLSRV
jgi:hypothetical protein